MFWWIHEIPSRVAIDDPASANTDPASLGDTIRRDQILVFRVAPLTAFGFGKGALYSQTRWSFPR